MRRSLLRFTVLTICALPAFSLHSSFAPLPSQDLEQRLQARFDSLYKARSIPGVTAAVAFPDGRVVGLASGLADRTKKIPMTSDALLMQGSVGKTYVSAIALQLVGEGKIRLDEKVEKYLGSYEWFARVPNAKDITVRMLMNHTSGVMRYEFKEEFTRDLSEKRDKFWKPEELVAYVLGDTASFAAGEGWEYSDTNYILLGMIIEKVTGSSYYDLLRSRILSPFSLKQTVPVEGRIVPGLIQGYAGEPNPFGGTDEMIADGKFTINPQFEWTGGGVASTSVDLARWATIVYEGKAFPSDLMKEFLDGVPARLGPNARYGLGVIMRPTRFGMSYGHAGFFPGYMTEMMYFPDHRFAIAVQVNTSEFRKLGGPLARILLALGDVVVEEMNQKKTME